MDRKVLIPSWVFVLAGPLVFVASLLMSYAVQAETTKEHSTRIGEMENDLTDIKVNLARICQKLDVPCR